MPIKVAYDISNLGAYFDRHDTMHGINRVTEELLIELCDREELDITAVSLSGTDPLMNSINSSRYLESKGLLRCGFDHTFRVRPGLTSLYTTVFESTIAGPDNGVRSHSAPVMCLRYLRAILYRMVYSYGFVNPERVFAPYKFDVFHCPHLGLPPKELTGDLPRVLTVYDLIPLFRPDFVSDYQISVLRAMLKEIDFEKDWIVCISEFTKEEFCEVTRISSERVVVAPLAPATNLHEVTDVGVIRAVCLRYQIPEGEYFLSLASPQPRKNLAHLIHCFFRLLDENRLPDTYLVLAGSKEQGWMYDDIFTAIDSSSSHRSQIVFTKYVDDEDLPALYSGAVAFVFPSLYEGFGLPALEAMACGTPVITSNTTSLPEVVGNAALLVDPTDADHLCEALLTMLTDHSLRLELKRKGLNRANEFSWKRCADQTAKVYEYAKTERSGYQRGRAGNWG